MNAVKAYVARSDGDFVRVKILNGKIKKELISIGFVNDIDLSEYKIATPGDEKKAEIFNRLRDMGVYFHMEESGVHLKCLSIFEMLGFSVGNSQ